MELTRKILLKSIYDYNSTTPKDSKFDKFAKNFILNHFGIDSVDVISDLDAFIRTFKNRAAKKMDGSGFKTFIEAPSVQTWLSALIPRPTTKDLSPVKSSSSYKPTGRKPGRPSKGFTASLKSARYAKVKKAVNENDLPFLFEALRMKLKRSGFKEASKVVEFLSENPELHGKKALKALSVQGNCLDYKFEALLNLILALIFHHQIRFSVYLHYVKTSLTTFHVRLGRLDPKP